MCYNLYEISRLYQIIIVIMIFYKHDLNILKFLKVREMFKTMRILKYIWQLIFNGYK